MKIIFKLTLAAILLTTTIVYAEQKEEDSEIGLSFGLNYISNYIYKYYSYYRGEKNNGGVFIPYVNYNVFNTGLNIGIKAGIPELMIGSRKEEETSAKTRKTMKYNQSIDFNLEYEYNIENIMTLGVGAWYYRFKTMQESAGLNFSYYDYYFYCRAAENIPLMPIFRVIYMTEQSHEVIPTKKMSQLYAQLGISHGFELAKETYLDLGVIAGFLHNRLRAQRDDKHGINDISDIDFSIGLSTTSDILYFSASFHYIIVPGKQYKSITMTSSYDLLDINKFYSQFGVGCRI